MNRLNHPVKRFKPDSKENQRNNRLGKGDLYSMCAQNGVLNNTNDLNHNNTKSQPLLVKQEIKQEPVSEYIVFDFCKMRKGNLN